MLIIGASVKNSLVEKLAENLLTRDIPVIWVSDAKSEVYGHKAYELKMKCEDALPELFDELINIKK